MQNNNDKGRMMKEKMVAIFGEKDIQQANEKDDQLFLFRGERIVLLFQDAEFRDNPNNYGGENDNQVSVTLQGSRVKTAYELANENHWRFFTFVYVSNEIMKKSGVEVKNDLDLIISFEGRQVVSHRMSFTKLLNKYYESPKNAHDIKAIRMTEGMSGGYQSAFIFPYDDSGIAALKEYMEYFDNRAYREPIIIEKIKAGTSEPKVEIPEELPLNWLLAGAPGTGKSNHFKKIINKLVEDEEEQKYIMNRVTFYEDYSYEDFVGSYKPTGEGKEIKYVFEPGPFIDIYLKAISHGLRYLKKEKTNDDQKEPTIYQGRSETVQPYFLIIEEINRAKAASVFGPLFQLLDREADGTSTYGVKPEPSLQKYLQDEIIKLIKEAQNTGNAPEYQSLNDDEIIEIAKQRAMEIKLPSNMYIWATMNSSDQGVFPLDSAFKRRWEYKYMSVHKDREEQKEKLLLNTNRVNDNKEIDWDSFRKAINRVILSHGKEEDCCLGPWYFRGDEIEKINHYTKNINEYRDNHESPLVSKLFFYLYQDLFRYDPDLIFNFDDFSDVDGIPDGEKAFPRERGISSIMEWVKNGRPIEKILNLKIGGEIIKLDFESNDNLSDADGVNNNHGQDQEHGKDQDQVGAENKTDDKMGVS